MPEILVLDVETLPIEAYIWQIWEPHVGLDQIQTEWTIAAFGAKWLGSKDVIYGDTGGRGKKKVRDDKKLCQKMWQLLDDADIVITQNGVAFDIKKINARMAMHGMLPPSPVKHVDIYKAAKKHFGFTSNRLAWMSAHFTDTPKSEHKKFPGFELWKECLKDNPAAWAEMKAYNIRDVVATENVYLKFRPWITGHPNLSIYTGSEKPECPKCQSTHLQARGRMVLASGIYPRYQCQGCGGWSRGRMMMNGPAERKAKLV
jgi:hypothetical protein